VTSRPSLRILRLSQYGTEPETRRARLLLQVAHHDASRGARAPPGPENGALLATVPWQWAQFWSSLCQSELRSLAVTVTEPEPESPGAPAGPAGRAPDWDSVVMVVLRPGPAAGRPARGPPGPMVRVTHYRDGLRRVGLCLC
jgi:hypothetical protein